VGAFTAPVARLPLAGNAPVQPPAAVQAVAPVELQLSVEEPPAATAIGEALRLAVGVTGGGTVTGAEPPPPQADKAETAPNMESEAINRMEIRSDLWSVDRIPRALQIREPVNLCAALRRMDSIMSHRCPAAGARSGSRGEPRAALGFATTRGSNAGEHGRE
jgi:hypothetical protein